MITYLFITDYRMIIDCNFQNYGVDLNSYHFKDLNKIDVHQHKNSTKQSLDRVDLIKGYLFR